MNRTILFFGITIGYLCFSIQAAAHFLWVYPEDTRWVIARGISPTNLLPYNPENIVDIRALDQQWNNIPIHRTDENQRCVFQADQAPTVVVVTSEWGMRVNTPDGKKLMTRQQALERGLQVQSAFLSTQYSKNFFGPVSDWSKPAGLRFEIVPLTSLDQARSDHTLPIRMLFDGKPLSGCQVFSTEDRKGVTTDPEGKVVIPIRSGSMPLIWGHLDVPVSNDPQIDYHQFMTFLQVHTPEWQPNAARQGTDK